jgi:hypothetical protein
MRARAALAALEVLAVLGCGSENERPHDPLVLRGSVTLGVAADGGIQTGVFVVVSRLLPDAGLLGLLDAGVALNGVPLGAPDFFLPEGPQIWDRSALPGATYGAVQILSVPGANPPLSQSFSCPQRIVFTAPEPDARVSRNMPLTLSWTPGGSTDLSVLLEFSIWQPLEGDAGVLTGGFGALDAGTLTVDVPFPENLLEAPHEARGYFTVFVPGESLSPSVCASAPLVSVVYPPGEPGDPSR